MGRHRALAVRAPIGAILVLGGLCLLLASACRSVRGETARASPRDAARIATEVSDWPRALSLWHDLWARSGHRDGEAAYEASRALVATGDRAGGEALLRIHVARAEDDPRVWTQLGHLELERGALDLAGASFSRALELDPAELRAATGLAQLHRARGEDRAALDVLEGAQRAAGATVGAARIRLGRAASLELGRAALQLGHWDEARRALGAAREDEPLAPGDLLATCAALEVARGPREEVAAEGSLVDVAPRIPTRIPTEVPSIAAGDEGDKDTHSGAAQRPPEFALMRDVIVWLRETRVGHPNRSDLPLAEAELLTRLGRWADAAAAARQALELDPGGLRAVELSVGALLCEGRQGEARVLLDHGLALELKPEDRVRLVALEARLGGPTVPPVLRP